MIKTIGFVVLWLAGSAAAVAVAWAGVSVVDDELIDPAPANDLSAAIVTDVGAGPSISVREPASTPSSTIESTTSTTSTTVAPTSTTAAPGSTTGLDGAAPAPPAAPAAPAPAPTPGAQPLAPPPATSAPGPQDTTPPAPAPTTPLAPAPAAAQTLTFDLVGGSTAISFSSSATNVLWATPNPGFEVSIQPDSPGYKVEFEADHHRSRIDVWWSDGPKYDIREEPDDD